MHSIKDDRWKFWDVVYLNEGWFCNHLYMLYEFGRETCNWQFSKVLSCAMVALINSHLFHFMSTIIIERDINPYIIGDLLYPYHTQWKNMIEEKIRMVFVKSKMKNIVYLRLFYLEFHVEYMSFNVSYFWNFGFYISMQKVNKLAYGNIFIAFKHFTTNQKGCFVYIINVEINR